MQAKEETMDDSNESVAAEVSNVEEPSSDDKPSIELLKKTAELSDITKSDQGAAQGNPLDSELKIEIADQSKQGSATIETVYENAGIDKTVSSVTPSNITHQENVNEIHNQIQTGRMNKLRDQASNIFPVGTMGCKQNDQFPPRRLLDAGEASLDNIGHIDNTPRKMLLRKDYGRNPVLGTGLDENDKRNVNKKENCDPKLPLSGSSARVPPGGYSHGIW